MIRLTVWELLGWCGACLLLIAYALLSLSMLQQNGAPFHVMNVIGALAVGKAALDKKSYPAAFVEFAWCLIAIVALVRISYAD